MKFLVLALCVCAASAARFPNNFGAGAYKGYKGFQPAPVAPVAVAAEAVASAAAPVVTPVAAAAAATYGAGAATYQAAKQVANTAYTKDGEAQILRSESDVASDGYKYTYENSNGISGEATGVLKQVGEESVLVSQGSYRYTAPDGTPVVVVYTADENGFQPQSDILPVGPATPEAILRSLEYIAAKSKETVSKY